MILTPRQHAARTLLAFVRDLKRQADGIGRSGEPNDLHAADWRAIAKEYATYIVGLRADAEEEGQPCQG